MKARIWSLLICVPLGGCSPDRSARLTAIGEYFCRQAIAGTTASLKDSNNVPNVVHVGQQLPDVLAGMRAELKSGYQIQTQRGDAFGGSGDVTDSIVISTSHDSICLRMRYDSSVDRFHLVGYSVASATRLK